MTIYPTRAFTPFADAASPLRAKHRDDLRQLAEWSLGVGRPIDPDVAAVCIEALEEDLEREPDRVLTRPTLNGFQWASVSNKASILNTFLPDNWRVHLWTLICWYAETGRLSAASDPLAVLLEPLQCYGGLGPDGNPRPEGEDVAFVCQCYVPYDKKLPEGIAKLIVGHDPATYEQLLISLHPQHRSVEPPASAFEPLWRLARRAGPATLSVRVDPLEWQFMGRTPASADVPELWVYSRKTKRHEYPRLLDATGTGWAPRINRRRKVGYVLRELSLVTTLGWMAARDEDDDLADTIS